MPPSVSEAVRAAERENSCFISASLHNGCYKLRGTHPTQPPTPRHRDTTGVTPENDERVIKKHTKYKASATPTLVLFPNCRLFLSTACGA